MHDQVPEFMLVLIVSGYLIIAFQFWSLLSSSGKAKKALLELISIFILCSVCGYLSRIVLIPVWLLNGLHCVLILFTYAFVFRHQASEIVKALND